MPETQEVNLNSRPPIHRIQVIWAALKMGYCVSATEFAEQLEVSTKTVHRDIECMRDRLGFGIHYDASRFGYVQTGVGNCPFCHPIEILSRYSFRHKLDPIELIESMSPEQREEEVARLREWLDRRDVSNAAAPKRASSFARRTGKVN